MTRDPLKEHIALDGLPNNLVDTVGLRESSDLVESEGIRRSHVAVQRGDRLLWVIDVAADLKAAVAEVERDFPEGPAATILQNKVDLAAEGPAELEIAGLPVIRLAALTGEGLPLLIAHLKRIAGLTGESGGTISARTRHIDALQRAGASLDRAREQFAETQALEFAAEKLRSAQAALSEITGELMSDDLLGEMFGSFCVGK